MTHDPQCRVVATDCARCPQCDLIARVRAEYNEREAVSEALADLRAKVLDLPIHEFQERTTISGEWGWQLREGLCRADVIDLFDGEPHEYTRAQSGWGNQLHLPEDEKP